MSLQLDVALREIYFNVNGGYMSMEKLYQKAKEEGVPGVSRKNVREWLQTQNTYIIHKPSRKHYKTQRTYVDGLAQQIQMDLVVIPMLCGHTDNIAKHWEVLKSPHVI
jgi:hypothetical protein